MKINFSGIKFLYTHTVPRTWEILKTFRVPKQSKLPEVLTIEETRRLLDAVRTEHNRVYFKTVYELGLRMTECLSLQVTSSFSARQPAN